MYFEKIRGQRFAKKYLSNSIKSNMISHAYMFEGPSGVGKNTMARELAATLLEMENLFNSPDYIEITPDGNSIKIAQIRKLQSDILVKPYKSYKIYVIDEAQKMTVEAQNALLKTLEEPPKYAIIILITNNKESLLDTIKSRCEIIKFTPIPLVEVADYLTQIGVDKNRASLLANFSRGSMQKAIELSESEDFHIMRDEVQKYVETFLTGSMLDIMDIQSSIEKYKDNITNVLDLLVNYFRDIMMVKENVDSSMIINLDRLVFIKNMSTKITYSQLSKIIDIIEETKIQAMDIMKCFKSVCFMVSSPITAECGCAGSGKHYNAYGSRNMPGFISGRCGNYGNFLCCVRNSVRFGIKSPRPGVWEQKGSCHGNRIRLCRICFRTGFIFQIKSIRLLGIRNSKDRIIQNR